MRSCKVNFLLKNLWNQSVKGSFRTYYRTSGTSWRTFIPPLKKLEPLGPLGKQKNIWHPVYENQSLLKNWFNLLKNIWVIFKIFWIYLQNLLNLFLLFLEACPKKWGLILFLTLSFELGVIQSFSSGGRRTQILYCSKVLTPHCKNTPL